MVWTDSYAAWASTVLAPHSMPEERSGSRYFRASWPIA